MQPLKQDDDTPYQFEDGDRNLPGSDSLQLIRQDADSQQFLDDQSYDGRINDATSDTPGSGGNQEMRLKSRFFAATIYMVAADESSSCRLYLTSKFLAATIYIVATDESSSNGSYISPNDETDDDASPKGSVDLVTHIPRSRGLLEDEATAHKGEACCICINGGLCCLFVKFVDEDGDM